MNNKYEMRDCKKVNGCKMIFDDIHHRYAKNHTEFWYNKSYPETMILFIHEGNYNKIRVYKKDNLMFSLDDNFYTFDFTLLEDYIR